MNKLNFEQIPFDKIVRVGQMSQLYRDLFCVSWILGRYCNYSCSYCWPYASTKVKDHRPLSKLIQTIEEIKRQARSHGFNSFHFSFSGGEPTVHPNFLDFIEHYSEDTKSCNYQSVHMTTNLSRSLKWYSDFALKTQKLHRVSITASFHPEFSKRDIFLEKLIHLQMLDIQVTINMVMAPNIFDHQLEDAIFFNSHGVNVTLKPQSNQSATAIVDGYNQEQLKILKSEMPQMDYTKLRLKKMGVKSKRPKSKVKISFMRFFKRPVMQVELRDLNGKRWYVDQAERLNALGFNKFNGWTCSSGYRSIIIREPGGEVKRSYSCRDKPLGTIDTGFRLFDVPQPCITNSCVSSADSKIPKKAPNCSLPLWRVDEIKN